MRLIALLVLMFVVSSAYASQSPCAGVDRALPESRKLAWAPGIARQLGVPSVDVLQSFRFGSWHIIYVDTHQSDEAFLFYPKDPASARYVTLWGGAAMWDEEQDIRSWVIKNAPGIPKRLAACFAWHVTKHRDR